MSEEPEWAARDRQIELLIDAISYMPNPASSDVDVPLPAMVRRPFAERLYDKGVRIHPPLATVETTIIGDPRLGAYAQAQTKPLSRNDQATWALLRQRNPELADRIAAASTDEEKAAILDELRPGAMHGIRSIKAMGNRGQQ